MRRAQLHRKTSETDIRLRLNLDGRGRARISTGIRFFDHMLELVARHGAMDLELVARGDLDVDQHHTVEDAGIALGEAVTKARAEAGLRVDAALTAHAATPELIHRLEAAGPFGAGAPEPVFALPRHRLAEVTAVGVEGRHLRLRAVSGDGRAVEGIAFRASGKKLGEALTRLKGAPVHLAGTLSVNRHGGRERAQIRVVDVAEATQ